MDDDDGDNDIDFYNISSQEWEHMIITSPDGLVKYVTETERPFLSSKSTTMIYKTDGSGSGSVSSSSAAKRVIARFDFYKRPEKDRVLYHFGQEQSLNDLFPKLVWPEGFRRVNVKKDDGWIWIGTRGEPTLLDGRHMLLAYYCPNLQRGSQGKDGKLAIASELSPDAIDLVITGFILSMHDADKLFGHLGMDVSPRSGYGGQNWMSVAKKGDTISPAGSSLRYLAGGGRGSR